MVKLLNNLWIAHVHKEAHTVMSIASLFVIANNQKQSK